MTEKRRELGVFSTFLSVTSFLVSTAYVVLSPYALLEPVRFFIYLPVTLMMILLTPFFISWNQENFTRMRAIYVSVSVGVLACALVFVIIKPSYTYIDATELVEKSYNVENTTTLVRWNAEKNYSDYVVQTEEDLAYAVDPYTGEMEELLDGNTLGEE